MKIQFHSSVFKQLHQLPRPVFSTALQVIIGLAADPRPSGARKLVGAGQDWRVRIGDYRIIYTVDDAADTVTVMRVAHRSEVYR